MSKTEKYNIEILKLKKYYSLKQEHSKFIIDKIVLNL